MDIWDDELKKNFRTSIEELVVKKDKKRKKVPVRVKEPPRTLRMNRLHYKYSLETKHYDSRLSFGLKEIETENYDATMYVKEGLTTSSVVRESNINYMVSKLAYTEITLVAEVAKYFPDIRCTEVARILRKSEEGIDKILVAVNEHNDIIYDKIVPTIFEALYRVNKEIVKENVDKAIKKLFKSNTEVLIAQKLPYWSKITGFKYNEFKIRDATTRYGSCMPSKKNVYFSSRLIMLPEDKVDAIIVHELCHMRHKYHNKDFYNLLQSYIPNYKEIDEWLKQHGKIIMF